MAMMPMKDQEGLVITIAVFFVAVQLVETVLPLLQSDIQMNEPGFNAVHHFEVASPCMVPTPIPLSVPLSVDC